MTTEQIQPGRVYRGTDGRTRKVQAIEGDRHGRVVVVRDATPTPKRFSLETFAATCAVEDVTPERSIACR